VPNRFCRADVHPAAAEARRGVAMKLNIITDVVKDRRIVVVDDSIVRGTTTRSRCARSGERGAKEIHLRISCPPIRNPCFYGIDFATRK